MARRVGPVKVRRYTLEFKLKAVKLSQLKGVEVQAVAADAPVEATPDVQVVTREEAEKKAKEAKQKVGKKVQEAKQKVGKKGY